ncbi:MAG TPA: hypothetical protein VK826_14315 [Bacteroidia bacterium]|nr:hypothetical protein [Bacteroidia bacterium]
MKSTQHISPAKKWRLWIAFLVLPFVSAPFLFASGIFDKGHDRKL